MTVLPLLLALSAAPPGFLSALPAAPPRAELALVAEHIEAWDLPSARVALAALETRLDAPSVDVGYLRARIAFYESRYEDAVRLINGVAAEAPLDRQVQAAVSLYAATRDTLAGYETTLSPRGRFQLAYPPGVDAVLVPYLGEALELAFDRLEAVFGNPQESPGGAHGPIRVEVLPKPDGLAAVSLLKASEIRTTGTVALCKYNRLMLVSPRALVYGYGWLDTAAHELVHLFVTRQSRNTVPVWLHEGLARYFEPRWRSPDPPRLDRPSEDLLSRALKQKTLIRFEAMSPSIAKLPGPEEAALAYAEVFTVMELLTSKHGEASLRRLVLAMRDGASDQAAVAKITGKSFPRFEREWRNALFGRNLRPLPTHADMKLHFRDTARSEDELEGLAENGAAELAAAADRLLVKQRYLAAAIEYEKALQKAGGPNPVLSARLASALLRLGHHTRVEAVVTPALEYTRGYGLLYLYRGKARLKSGDAEGARRDLIEAIRQNPFDPEVHDLLASALELLGEKDEAELERRRHRMVARN